MDVDLPARNSSRLKTHASSPLPSISLTHVHVTDALKQSPDNGATLDFARQNITDVGESGIEELATVGREDLEDESSVLRIALGNNRLTTLPMGFALLSRLRYLNLRNNNFTIFPEVLTVMPSLDTLDIGHNKIKRLPSQAGSMVNLRVFNFSRNKLIRVPSYFSKLDNLEILKFDRNPIEWPPKSVMEPPLAVLNTTQGMKDWIHSLQKWLDANTPKTEIASFGQILVPNGQNGSEIVIEDRSSWQSFQVNGRRSRNDIVPHSRSFSRDSTFSMSSIDEESLLESQASTSSLLDRPHLSHLNTSHSRSASPSPTRIFQNYLPSPEESTDEGFAAVTNLIRQQQQHARNSSLIVETRSPSKKDLPEKMSMPDLRTARINFTRKAPDLQDHGPSNSRALSKSKGFIDEFSIPSPLSQQHDSGSSDEPSIFLPSKPFARDPITESPTSSDQPAPSMDVERNSYFRRFSALTASTISTALPEPLIQLIDAARSILFAVSQVYQTLRHYTVFVIDERLASVLRKVLDPASTDMMHLITALDRFDSMSRKVLPSPRVCRAVVESCKDTVFAFGKAIGVLSLQLKVLASRDDIRYVRLMLLMFYGATAEISYAWRAMLPHVEAVKPLIRDIRRPLRTRPHPPPSPTPAHGFPSDLNSAQNTSFPNTRHAAERPILFRTHSDEVLGGLGIGKTHTARRHAGSFSSKDVEIGKALPSYEPVPFLPANLTLSAVPRTSALRVNKRQMSSPNPAISSPSGSATSPSRLQTQNLGTSSAGGRIGKVPMFSHSRQGSQASLQTSASSSSPSIPLKPSHLELPLNSRAHVDKEALDAMKVAVEAAPAVWEMVYEILADVLETNVEVRESLALAKIVTKRLKENIIAVQRGDTVVDKKGLRDDAHLFVKTVVQLSNAIKTHGASHSVSSSLRSKMVTLTNATEEFVILLHVSSFSPATSRLHSPMFSPSASWAAQRSPLASSSVEESRLGASISRNRNALSAGSALKLANPPPRNGPRSAVSNQTLPAPPVPRPPEKRETGLDGDVSR